MILTLINFRHHQKLELELPSQGVILLSGASGQGKSTVLSALEWLLFGRMRKVSTFGQTKTMVSLVYDGIAVQSFRDENGNYPLSITITRKKDPGLLKIICGTKEYIDDEAQSIIYSLFGYEDVFLSSSYLRQGERSLLLDGKSSDKMNLIEQYAFNAEDITKYIETIDTQRKNTEKSLTIANATSQLLEDQLEKYKTKHVRPLEILKEERHSNPELSSKTIELYIEKSNQELKQLYKTKNELEIKENTRNQILEINKDTEKQIFRLESQLPSEKVHESKEMLEHAIEKLTTELNYLQLFNEYKQIRTNDFKTISEFHLKHGRIKPVVENIPTSQQQYEISSELSVLEQQYKANKLNTENNRKVQTELDKLNIPTNTIEKLEDELEVSTLMSEIKSLKDIIGDYIETNVDGNLDELESRHIELSNQLDNLLKLEKLLEKINIEDVDEIKHKIDSLKLKLDTKGIKIPCPNCKTDLLYCDNKLSIAPIIKATLPPRIGAKPIAVSSPKPVEEEVVNPEKIKSELIDLEAAYHLFQTTELMAIEDCQEKLSENKRVRKALIEKESKRPLLIKLKELQTKLGNRNTDRLPDVILNELNNAKQYKILKDKLKDIVEVDINRIEFLRNEISSIDEKKEAFRVMTLFEQHEERVKYGKNQRIKLLRKILPDKTEDELENIDLDEEYSVVTRPLKDVNEDIKSNKNKIELIAAIKNIENKVDVLKSTIKPVPDSVSQMIENTSDEIRNKNEYIDQMNKIKTYIEIENELKDMEMKLAQKRSECKAENRNYLLLEKLKTKALEAETLTLEKTIGVINQEIGEQLLALFTDPISVRFETTKELQNGRQKCCINLSINYRGKDYESVSQLSGGEQARVSLAITLALNKSANSPLLMLDESLAALDADLVDTVVDTLKIASASYSIPIFVVLHNSVTGMFDNVIEF